MNLIDKDKLIPHLVFVAALLPTVLLIAAAALSLSQPDPIVLPLPIQAAVACQPCESPPPVQ